MMILLCCVGCLAVQVTFNHFLFECSQIQCIQNRRRKDSDIVDLPYNKIKEVSQGWVGDGLLIIPKNYLKFYEIKGQKIKLGAGAFGVVFKVNPYFVSLF